MRNLTSLISAPKSPDRRPPVDARREAEKRPTESKPKPKRCLNEAAHKLDR